MTYEFALVLAFAYISHSSFPSWLDIYLASARVCVCTLEFGGGSSVFLTCYIDVDEHSRFKSAFARAFAREKFVEARQSF